MRILFLLCALYVASVESALAIKPASPEEIKDIQEQMFIGNRMDAKVRKADRDLSIAKAAKAVEAEIIRLEKTLAREKDKQSAARTKAIHMTILAYGLEPAVRSGTSVMPWTKGRTISWLPVAREREARQIQSADGELRRIKQGGDYAGITYIDGVTYMDPSAFEKGPGYLASYLLHERIHFEQFTTPGRGNAMTYAEAQKEAYQAQVDNAEYFFDPKVPTGLRMMQDIEILRDTEKARVDQEAKARQGLKGLIRRLLPAARPPDIFESKVHTNAELADISGLVAQARSHADKAQRDREKREKILRAAAEKRARLEHEEREQNARVEAERQKFEEAFAESRRAQARVDEANELQRRSLQPSRPTYPSAYVPPPPFSTALPRIREFAIAACRAPDQVPLKDPFLYKPYDRSSVQNDDDLARGLAMGLDDCSRQLFYKLIATIRAGEYLRIDRQWIRSMVAAYTPVYIPPPSRGPRCEDFGVSRCPCEDGTPGCEGGKSY